MKKANKLSSAAMAAEVRGRGVRLSPAAIRSWAGQGAPMNDPDAFLDYYRHCRRSDRPPPACPPDAPYAALNSIRGLLSIGSDGMQGLTAACEAAQRVLEWAESQSKDGHVTGERPVAASVLGVAMCRAVGAVYDLLLAAAAAELAFRPGQMPDGIRALVLQQVRIFA